MPVTFSNKKKQKHGIVEAQNTIMSMTFQKMWERGSEPSPWRRQRLCSEIAESHPLLFRFVFRAPKRKTWKP